MYANRHEESTIESVRTHVEKIMMTLPPEKTVSERKMYLAGVIDTFRDFEEITEEQRDVLYVEFVG